jgi:hypothetical protein
MLVDSDAIYIYIYIYIYFLGRETSLRQSPFVSYGINFGLMYYTLKSFLTHNN